MSLNLPLQQFSDYVANDANKPYLHQPDQGSWSTYSYADVDTMARKIAAGLIAQGYEKGDRIAILAKNSAEWVISDLAIMMAGMISVPIYSTAGVETIKYVLEHSEAKAVFVGKLDSLEAAEQACSDVYKIAYPYPTISADSQWQDWLTEHSPLESINQPDPEDIMTLVYTSGSTGLPKGVVLSYLNLASSVTDLHKVFGNEHSRFLSYLPMAHITERSIVGVASFYYSVELFFNDSMETFVDDLIHARVTSFVTVPRLWAKFQSQVLASMPNEQLQAMLKSEQGEAVAAQIREKLGFGECSIFSSGSAPISLGLLQWFAGIGVNIGEGWGMTETSGAACLNSPFDSRMLGTIGLPASCVEMKLSDEDEILIRGDMIFKSYYKNPQATEESFIDGWFKTGDCARVDENGAWMITGRTKEKFKTAKGKYVAPVPIESQLSGNPYIEQICIVGSGMPQPVALVVASVSGEQVDAAATQSMRDTLQQVNSTLESHARIAGIFVTKAPWAVENGLLTPTLKLKRNNIENLYNPMVEAGLPNDICWECEQS